MLTTIKHMRRLNKSGAVAIDSRQNCRFARQFKQDQDGGIIILTLLLLMSMLVVGGMAVDFMRFEAERTRLQSVNDRAILAAANLNEDRDPAAIISDFFTAEGYENAIVGVPDIQKTANGSTVTVNSQIDMDTFFLRFIGMETLSAPATATAMQGTGNVEISLVLDMSGSMGVDMTGPIFRRDENGDVLRDDNGKIRTFSGERTRMFFLQQAAKQFVTDILKPEYEDRVSINLIAYSTHVALRDDLYMALNTTPDVIRADNRMGSSFSTITDGYNVPLTYQWVLDDKIVEEGTPGAVLQARPGEVTLDANAATFANGTDFWRNPSRCVTFTEAEYQQLEFNTTRTYTQVEQTDVYAPNNSNPHHEPDCHLEPKQGIVLMSQNITELHEAIDAFVPYAATSIHRGMKWGVSLLDPSMRELIGGIPTVDAAFRGTRPIAYEDSTAAKFIIIMTDGETFTSRRLKRDVYGDSVDYYDEYSEWAGLGTYSVQYHAGMDGLSSTNWSSMTQQIGTVTELDDMLEDICDLAATKVEDVFTIAMGVKNKNMTDCASEPGNAFETTITNEPGKPGLSDIFDTIANQITALRLSL